MRKQSEFAHALIPMQTVGPVKISGPHLYDELAIPLATLETPLWPSTHRGALACNRSGGIQAMVIDERMTRSIVVQAANMLGVEEVLNFVESHRKEIEAQVERSSEFAKLLNIHTQVVGTLVYFRLEFNTGDAAGHNMSTLAAQYVMDYLLAHLPQLEYVSISANYCSDKKNSAVNGILGRGKYVVAEVRLPAQVLRYVLKTTAEKIVQINLKKNYIGSILAGSVRSANAHFANMLLAYYLATGQDAANIIEGSQGIVFAEQRQEDLYFSVTLPNIILGTVGHGKALDYVQHNLRLLGCTQDAQLGQNAQRLAIGAAAAVLCGELSLLAAQTVPGELMRAHLAWERQSASKG